ncbi:F0F1 ATP synthase subunit A [Mycoplasmopsis agassizii]|uniref:F0F1 ATP synthase subunit A n=1 Tax=Mycoplasmopsis agassizii TaxID=33922 RepID=A0ABX4H567_9BACT|nr:F0F1 ATP synthase subunit A [Mycoplasmopsis agassizii]PAF55042.1 F0F1 ATP synthase subunit A [Mycoplasmopsis agassizii]SMC17436.1 F-type H+-transporting ATPase subunit a [Mycoplasmopsis agassizii]
MNLLNNVALQSSAEATPEAEGSLVTSQIWVVQPQIVSLVLTLIIILVLALWIFIRLKKANPKKAPKGVIFAAEQYVGFFETTFKSATDGKINFTAPYLFTLFTFLLIGNLLPLVGFPALATSYSIPLLFAFITWSMIYVIAIMFERWKMLKRYLNPIEIVGQFIPLISLSVRMFGNITTGSVVTFLLYSLSAWFLNTNGQSTVPNYVLGPLLTPLFHLYLDAFSALIQSYVFMLLSMIYWVNEASDESYKHKLARDAKKKKHKSQQVLHLAH